MSRYGQRTYVRCWRIIVTSGTAAPQRASLFRFLKDGAGAPPLGRLGAGRPKGNRGKTRKGGDAQGKSV